MNSIGKLGFFAEYYLNIKNICGDNEINQFSSLKNDLERVTYLHNQKYIRENELKVNRKFEGKNVQQSLDCKESGNAAFKNKKWIEALILYTKSILLMPSDNKNEMAILYANRSAALYHMEKYNEALLDVQRSIEYGYSKEMLHKILERRGRCHLALKNYIKALEDFRSTVTSLDDCKLPLEKKQKLEKDAIIMIKMLEKDPQTTKNLDKNKKSKNETQVQKPHVSDALKMDFNEQEGRFIRAAKDVKVGDELLVEKPNVAALIEKFCKSHCQHCFIRTVTPIPCLNCCDVIFCSEKCQKLATYHKFECGILPTLWKSGTSINCHLAFRLIASKPLDYFLKIKDKLEKDLTFDQIKSYPYNDYLRICNLVRHENKRNASSFFQLSLMARFLTQCLIETDYFANYFAEAKKSDILFISSLILRNLQFLQFNTHEVSELHTLSSSQQKTAFIGGGVYSTLALFNHSCDPGIVRYFRGNTIFVNAIKSIDSGLPICENYGLVYTQDSFFDRQTKLNELYWFNCNCDACIENWPKFDDMKNDVIRFRCDADEPCDYVIEIPPDVNDFMIKCDKCGQFTNILKGLKAIQDTEMINKTSKRLYDACEFQQALLKYIDLLKILNEVLAPPFRDYCQAQQNIRDCYLNLGNAYQI